MNKTILSCFLIVIISTFFVACSEEVTEELQVKEIIKPQLEAMDKAKEVEGLLQDAVEQREQRLEQQKY